MTYENVRFSVGKVSMFVLLTAVFNSTLKDRSRVLHLLPNVPSLFPFTVLSVFCIRAVALCYPIKNVIIW